MNFFPLFVLFASVAASAAPALSQSELIRLSLKQNQKLKAAELNVTAMQKRVSATGLLENPEIEVSYGRSKISGKELEVEFSQAFPLGARLKSAKRVARVDVASAALEVIDYRLEVIQRVKSAIFAVLGAKEKLALTVNDLAVRRAFESLIRQKVADGLAKVEDLLVAEQFSEEGEEARQLVELEGQVALTEFLPLIAQEVSGVKGELATELARLWSATQVLDLTVALARRPDIKISELNADRARAEKQLVKDSRFGDLTIGLFVERDYPRDPEEASDTMAGIKFSLPLPFWNMGRSEIAEKDLLVQKGLRELALKKAEVLAELRTLKLERSTQVKVCDRRREKLLPLAKKLENHAREEYMAGETGIEHYIHHASERLAADLAVIECDVALAQLLTRVEKAWAK